MKKHKKNLVILFSILAVILFFVLMSKRHRYDSMVIGNLETNRLATNEEPRSLGFTNIKQDSARPQLSQGVNIGAEQMEHDSERELSLWQSSLRYFGKVVDENGKPISNVKVSYGANSLNESRVEVYNTGSVTTDERGIFNIEGVRGIGLTLQLSHPGYYPYPDNSLGFDKRSLPQKGYFSDSEEKAELFRMHSKGHPAALIHHNDGFHAPNNGSIANYPLRGNTQSELLGMLQIQGWGGIRSETNSYDWQVQLTIPEGGIVESTNYFDFVAPETGYAKSINVQVAGSESIRKQYFLKLPACYVRFKLLVIMGKDMFVSGEYYFNPDGSRNLELGQAIHPTQ